MKKIILIIIINFISTISFSQNILILQKINNILKKEYFNPNVSFNKYAKVLVIDIDEEENQFDVRKIVLKYTEKLDYDNSHKGGYALIRCISSSNSRNCITVEGDGEVKNYSQIAIKLNNKSDFNLLDKYISELSF